MEHLSFRLSMSAALNVLMLAGQSDTRSRVCTVVSSTLHLRCDCRQVRVDPQQGGRKTRRLGLVGRNIMRQWRQRQVASQSAAHADRASPTRRSSDARWRGSQEDWLVRTANIRSRKQERPCEFVASIGERGNFKQRNMRSFVL